MNRMGPGATDVPNHKMFVLARESRGLTQTQLGKRIGVTQGTISKIENGTLLPPSSVLSSIATELSYPERFFYTPLEQRSLPVTFYRKRKSLPMSALKRIEATTNLRRLHLATLLRSVEFAEPRLPEAAVARGVTAREIALETRASWGVPRGPIENMTKLLEDNGIIVITCNFGNLKIDGLSFFDRRDHLPPMICVNDSIPGDRLRFTLAHELGHLVLHNHLPLPPEECEPEADDFASEFLMPESEIRGHLNRVTLETLFRLKPHWKVAASALIMRASQLGKITDRQKQYLYMQMNARGIKQVEPIAIPREEPTTLREVVNTHLTDLSYDERELSEAMALHVAEFREFYRPGVPSLRLLRAT